MPGIEIGPFVIGSWTIGPLAIRYYGIIVTFGVMAAVWLIAYEARRRKCNEDLIWDGLVDVVLPAIIGARLWHIFTPPTSMLIPDSTGALVNPYFFDGVPQWKMMLSIWNGGIGIPGAVLGGALGLWIYTRRKKVSFAELADLIVPGLALGQAIGRWGNFVNQELYGAPTDLPWAITIDPQHRLPEYAAFSRFHPLFLYESIWNLLNMALLLFLSRRYSEKLRPGDLLLIYLIVYPVGRFFLDFLRLDIVQFGEVNPNQVFMAIVAVTAAITLVVRRNRGQ